MHGCACKVVQASPRRGVSHVPRLDTNFPAPAHPATRSLSLDAYAVGVGGASSCADAAVSILKEVVRNASEYG